MGVGRERQEGEFNRTDQLAWHERHWENGLEAALYVRVHHLYVSIQISC